MQITNARITLVVDGEEKTFSEEELASIVKKHLAQNKVAISSEEKPIERPMHPTEGVPFEVNPFIDRNLFQEKREDRRQEWTRQLILEAFAMVDENPKKYGKPFKTLMPEKTWQSWKKVGELIDIAYKLGNHEADWVEQALEWAQRIFNGETWEDICNNPDTANWYRLVKWKNGYYRLVGGSRGPNIVTPASHVISNDFGSSFGILYTVPLVVL